MLLALSLAALVAAAPHKKAADDLPRRAKAAIEATLKDAKVTITGDRALRIDIDGETLGVRLENLAKECAVPEACDDAIQAHADALKETLAYRSKEADAQSTLLLSIKLDAYIANVEKIQTSKAGHLVSRPLVGALNVVLVDDRPSAMRMINNKDLQDLKLEPEAAFDQAMQNLSKLPTLEPVTPRSDVQVFLLHSEDGYCSSRILLLERWRERAKTVKGDLVMAVPAREVVLYTGTEEPGGLEMLQMGATHFVEGTHGLDNRLYRLGEKGWEVYSPL